ncbi:MAG: hypothetical protein OEX16_06305, partial [Hadesarchaea archaeon]|nr:hypothetical protein [Hadesarchaea archaeon]
MAGAYPFADKPNLAPLGPEAPSGPTMHVLRIDMELLVMGQSYQGKATVYIVDENDNAVPSATVYGHWEGIVPS